MNINFFRKNSHAQGLRRRLPRRSSQPSSPAFTPSSCNTTNKEQDQTKLLFSQIISFISLILSHFQFCLNHCLNKIEFLLMAIHYLIDWINLVWLSRLSKELSLTTPVPAAPTQLKSKVTFSWLDPRIFQSLKISPSPRKVQSLKIALSVGTWRDLGKIKC